MIKLIFIPLFFLGVIFAYELGCRTAINDYQEIITGYKVRLDFFNNLEKSNQYSYCDGVDCFYCEKTNN